MADAAAAMGDRAHGIVMNQRCSTRAGEKLGWQPAGPSIGDDSVAAMPGPDVSPAVHPEAFSAGEAAFLDQEALGRLAYLDASGAPVVVPVAFRRTRDEQGASVIAIAGHELRASAKYRSLARDPRCAIVVDSSIGPSARGVLVKGTAALVDGPGRPLIVITPTRV